MAKLLEQWKESGRIADVTRDTINWLVEFLQPYRKETDKLQGEKYPTLPLALPAICILKKHLEPNVLDTFPQACLRRRAATFCEAKIKPTMRQKVATFLCPAYRQLLMLGDQAEQDEVCNN